MMNLLAIDTSTEHATVALAVGGEIYSKEQGQLRQHAQFLLPMIEELLAEGGLSCHQLDGVVFGCGPGSFTGLRIACSVAKGLAYAHDKPLFPVSSLAAIAYEVGRTERAQFADANILAMIDARMQQVYWGCFIEKSFHVAEQVSNAADIVLTTTNPLILAGVGLESYVDDLSTDIQSRIVKQLTIYPQATAMIHLVQDGKVQAVSAAEALPVYIRNQVTHGGESSG